MAKAFGPKITRSDFCMKVVFDKVCDNRPLDPDEDPE